MSLTFFLSGWLLPRAVGEIYPDISTCLTVNQDSCYVEGDVWHSSNGKILDFESVWIMLRAPEFPKFSKNGKNSNPGKILCFLVLWGNGIFLVWKMYKWPHTPPPVCVTVYMCLCVWERERGRGLWVYGSAVRTCCYTRPLINWWNWVVETPSLDMSVSAGQTWSTFDSLMWSHVLQESQQSH